MMLNLILDNIEAYVNARIDLYSFLQENKTVGDDYDWTERNDLNQVVQRRLDGLMSIVKMHINEQTKGR